MWLHHATHREYKQTQAYNQRINDNVHCGAVRKLYAGAFHTGSARRAQHRLLGGLQKHDVVEWRTHHVLLPGVQREAF